MRIGAGVRSCEATLSAFRDGEPTEDYRYGVT